MRAPRRLLAGVLVATGCFPPATGMPFHGVKAPKDMAVVYIYRPNAEEWRSVRYHVTTRRGPVVWLIRGGYFAYFAEPGTTEFWADTSQHTSVTEYLVAGKSYYLKATVESGGWWGRPELVFVPAEIGRPEVAECVLLPPAEPPADAEKRVVP